MKVTAVGADQAGRPGPGPPGRLSCRAPAIAVGPQGRRDLRGGTARHRAAAVGRPRPGATSSALQSELRHRRPPDQPTNRCRVFHSSASSSRQNGRPNGLQGPASRGRPVSRCSAYIGSALRSATRRSGGSRRAAGRQLDSGPDPAAIRQPPQWQRRPDRPPLIYNRRLQSR